ncbi:autotransporter-associated beta strand repeat-containing protein [uncultured Rhodoblastus sp.]|uniref:autotransporter-associated beta strand repeat-containing protein n=1 Tax=uncultured Rhodoblastus sp. TaxID=543037 RepID=UPI0025F5C112|nr:autotransporter-associated beta strand repeat-containing protein [uncultured Rhodoblastus sp.]
MTARPISHLALIVAAGLWASPSLAQTAINLQALQGLVPFATLPNTAAGQAALNANLSITAGVQNGTGGQPLLLGSFAAQQGQALKDAVLTTPNAYQLADGLGTKLAASYQSQTSWTLNNFSQQVNVWTGISPSVNNLINYSYSIAGSDSNAGKYFFANLTTNGSAPVNAAAQTILSNAGGHTNVFGVYGNNGQAVADAYGNSRPFQTVPGGVTIYSGADYFGNASSNQNYLTGSPTPATLYGQNLTNSPAFPSGHTTYGYTESLLLALLVPERYQQMVTRGAEYGNSRIVIGGHYAMDVIAGRTLSAYDLAQMLANNPTYLTTVTYSNSNNAGTTTVSLNAANNYSSLFNAAKADLTGALQAGCGASVASCAGQDSGVFAKSATNKAFYESTQTYGLPVVNQNTANVVENVNAIAPEAGNLLATRFSYLTQAQRNDVLTSTEGPGGGFLDNGSAFGLYSRLDLYKAAGGYGAFASTVSVTQNAALGGFNAADTWSNDISGPGGLTKDGTGALTLSGANTYAGPTTVNGGALIVSGSIVSATSVNAGGALAGTGVVGPVVNRGVVAPGDSDGAPGILTVNGTYFQGSDGALEELFAGLTAGKGYSQLDVTGLATLDGLLDITTASGFSLQVGEIFTILKFASLKGNFAGLDFNGAACSVRFGRFACAGDVWFSEQFSAGALNLVVDRVGGVGAVPEPSTWALMLLGFGGLGFASLRKTRKSSAVAA